MLASTQGRGGGESEASGASIGGEYKKDGWVKSGGVVPLYQFFLSGLAFALASSVGLSSWGWVESSLGE